MTYATNFANYLVVEDIVNLDREDTSTRFGEAFEAFSHHMFRHLDFRNEEGFLLMVVFTDKSSFVIYGPHNRRQSTLLTFDDQDEAVPRVAVLVDSLGFKPADLTVSD